MFGNAQEQAKLELAESTPAKPVSTLGAQAHAFFAGRSGKVSAISAPRPTRPGTPAPQRASLVGPSVGPAQLSAFAAASDPAAARAREEAMDAEADIVDDMFFECDSPGG